MRSKIFGRDRLLLACHFAECSVYRVFTFTRNERIFSWYSIPASIFLTITLLLLTDLSLVHAGCREEQRDLCESICPSNSKYNCTIRAAVILPATSIHEMSLTKILPALELAQHRIKKNRILPKEVDFEWMAYDDKCDASYAAVSAMDAYGKDCAHVIFGPACDYALATVGRITKYFHSEGTPLITVGGFTFDFQKPKTTCLDEFYMLLRAGMLSFRDIGMFTVSIMNKYDWTHALYFYERNGYYSVAGLHTCHLAMNTLAEFYRAGNITYSSFVTDAGTGNLTEDMIREIGVTHGDTRYMYSVVALGCGKKGNLSVPRSFKRLVQQPFIRNHVWTLFPSCLRFTLYFISSDNSR